MIDLGEMRGAEPHYDLAFFLVQDTAEPMLPELLLGYAEAATIPDDLDVRLRRSATVIVATQLCRWVVRDGVESLERPSGLWWLERRARPATQADACIMARDGRTVPARDPQG